MKKQESKVAAAVKRARHKLKLINNPTKVQLLAKNKKDLLRWYRQGLSAKTIAWALSEAGFAVGDDTVRRALVAIHGTPATKILPIPSSIAAHGKLRIMPTVASVEGSDEDSEPTNIPF